MISPRLLRLMNSVGRFGESLLRPSPPELIIAMAVVFVIIGMVSACAAGSNGEPATAGPIFYAQPSGENLENGYVTRIPYNLDDSVCYVLHNAEKHPVDISCIVYNQIEVDLGE